jgi:hypothetical protein
LAAHEYKVSRQVGYCGIVNP